MYARTQTSSAGALLGKGREAPSTRITLRLSLARRFFYRTAILGCAALVLGVAYYTALELRFVAEGGIAFRPGEIAPFLAVMAAAVLAGTACARRVSRIPGYIETSSLGLVLDTYHYAGILPPAQVTAVGSARFLGTKYLGIRIKDVDAFIGSLSQMKAHNFSGRHEASHVFVRFLAALAPAPVLNLVLRLFGCGRLPKAPTAADLLRWNGSNAGFHILIPASDVPRFRRTLEALSAHAVRPA